MNNPSPDPCYLIYHPSRKEYVSGNLKIYHDKFGGNEDPYLWNYQFLHTFCHITQLRNETGQINFWISGDKYQDFERLFCDCVFVIEHKIPWETANSISRNDSVVDNDQTYEHHYQWVNPPYCQHVFKRRTRYTLKAHPRKSFQPQDHEKKLIDIVPFLVKQGIKPEVLSKKMAGKRGSRPYRLPEGVGQRLYNYLDRTASIKLTGSQLANRHPTESADRIISCNPRGHKSC